MATTLTQRTPGQQARPPGRLDVVASTVVVFTAAVSLPLLELLGRHAEFLVAHQARAADLVVLTAALTVLLPGALAAAVLASARRSERLGVAVHYGLLTVLAALMFGRVLTRVPFVDQRAALALLLALVAGAALTAAYHLVPALRGVLRLGVVAPVVLAGLFLFASPASALLAGGGSDGRATTIGNPAPVIMVIFDELPVASLLEPGGDIDADLFPAFARLADTSTWYRDATTPHHSTTMALPAILTGRHTPEGLLPIAGDHPDNLFALLAGEYEFHVIEPMTDLCPVAACGGEDGRPGLPARLRAIAADLRVVALHMVLPGALRDRLPAVDEGWAGFGAGGDAPDDDDFHFRERVELVRLIGEPQLFRRFVESIEPAEGPTLHFLHVLLPHSPWRYYPTGETYGPARTIGRVRTPEPRWTDEEPLVHHSYQRHLWQLLYTDRLLGEALDRLEATGRFDDSLIVVTADHGIAFQPGQRRRHADERTLAEVAAVPLFVKLPGQDAGRTVTEPVQLIDIVPTITRVLEIDDAPEADGRAQHPDVSPTFTRSFTTRGEPTITFGPLTDDLLEAAARRQRVFGSGFPDLATTLPHAGIIGEEVAGLPVVEPAATWRVFIADRDAYRSVRLDRELPGVIRGRLYAPERLDEGTLVAIALNGRVVTLAALAEFEEGRSARFYALAGVDAFVEGDNDLQVYALEPGAPLRLLSVSIRN